MFFTRRDGAVKSQMKRRLKSPRASVYLEYAIVMPLVVMLVSALIEFTSLWDAKIMANHAAWTVGRIATVRPKMVFSEKLSEKLDSGLTDDKMSAYMKAMLAPLDAALKGANKFNNCGNVATMFLMSTCSNGYWGQSISGDLKSMLEKMIKDPLKLLKENLTSWMTDAIVKNLTKFLPDSIAGPVGDIIVGILKDIIENIVFKPLSSLIEKITDLLFPSGIFDWIQGLLEKDRTVRGIFYAASRIAKNDVVTVEELTKKPFAFSANIDGWGKSRRLSFPRCLDNDITIRDTINQVEKDSSWPPNKNLQPMYKIKVAWPFERTWLFPIVSGYEKVPAEDGLAKPTAVGYSLVYSQPDIANTNLLSSGAEVFSDGTQTNEFADVLKDVKQEVQGFMKTVAFGMRYRLAQEVVRPYDSNDKKSHSHKGLGNGGVHDNDGLVFWMGRAPSPDKHDKYGEWTKRNNASPSYNKSWHVRANGGGQTDLFDNWIFGRTGLYKNLDNENTTHKTLWWFWTLDSEPPDSAFRRRYTTTEDGEVKGNWHDRQMTNYQCFKQRTTTSDDCYTFWSDDSRYVNHIIGESDYNQKYGLSSIAPYSSYKQAAEQVPMSQTSWLNLYESQNVSLLAREKGYAYTNQVLCARFDKIVGLVKDCATELERQNQGEESEDVDGQLDWGTDEEEMWKDPKKAAEKVKAKLENLKKDNFRLLQEVDDAIDDIYKTWKPAYENVVAACQARQSMLLEFHKRLAAATMSPTPTTDVAEIRRRVLTDRGDTGAYESTFREAEEALKKTAAALERAWEAELAYGNLFKLQSAKKHGDKSLDDLDPGKGDDPVDPNIPPESGPETGTDDDWGGESWTRGKPGEGWRQ